MDHYVEETFSLIGVVPEPLYIHYMLQEAEGKFCPFEEKKKIQFHPPGFSLYCKGNKGNQVRLGAFLGYQSLIQLTIATKLYSVHRD